MSRKALVTCGLAILAGPLSFQAPAQDYVDLEAERAAAEAAGRSTAPVPDDPYGVQPAQAYPAASYGAGGTTAVPAPAAGAAAAAPVPASAGGGANLSNLFYQLQQLQQEVMRLNGRVEEQAHELRMLKEQSLQRYVDLDKRLSSAGAAGAAATDSPAPANPVATTPPPAASAGGVEQPGEAAAYDAAYGLVKGRRFDEAVNAFQQFLRNYPDGRYAPNAYYWLGELYLVMDPPDLESSRQAFALLVSEYPEHSKTADALYKLGKVQFMKGNREKAREYLDLVVRQYSSSNPTVAKLARDFIAENY